MRTESYGAIGAHSAMPPFFVTSAAVQPMRRMLMSRCSLLNPSSDDRFLRTRSPSSSVTGRPPISSIFTISALAIVDLPDPDSPVKNTVKPCFARGGYERRSSVATSGKVNQDGMSLPCCRRSRSSVPEMFSVRAPSGTSSTGKYASLSSTYTIIWNGTISTPSSSCTNLQQLLRVVRTVERLALRVVARAGVVASDDEVRAAVVLADDRVPTRLRADRPCASRAEAARASRCRAGSAARRAS